MERRGESVTDKKYIQRGKIALCVILDRVDSLLCHFSG